MGENDSNLRAALNGMAESFYVLQAQLDEFGVVEDFIITDLNASAAVQFQESIEALIGVGVCGRVPELLFEKYTQAHMSADILREEIFITDLGWFYYQIIPLTNGLSVFAKDITAQKQAEGLLRNINDNVREGIYRSTPEDGFVYVNQPFVEMFGYESVQEVMALKPEQLYAYPYQRLKVLQNVNEMRFFANVEVLYRRKDGTEFWGFNTGNIVYDNAGQPIYYDGVIVDISERKKIEEDYLERERLTIALQKEREMSQLRKKLMTTITHEFRTPLAIILSSSELLDRYFERLNEEKRHHQLQKIKGQIKILSEMLKDISLVSEGNFKHIVLQESYFDLEQTIQAMIHELQETIGKDHQFVFNMDDIRYRVVGDRLLIRRMLISLLSNAIKYSEPGTTIRISLLTSNKDVIIIIKDEGMGIERSEFDHIFEPFHRGNNAIHISGAGLGLAIVKECVTLHDGHIAVQSELKKGATFTIRMPILDTSLSTALPPPLRKAHG